MRHLITGRSGFAGSHLAALLAGQGETVLGLDRHGSPAVDLLDRGAVQGAVADFRPDRVYHLAAQSGVARSWRDPLGTFRVNVEGTINLLLAVAESARSARVLLVSTSEVYGRARPEGKLLAEEDPLQPENPYALSKLAAELYAQLLGREKEIQVIRVRPAGHIGPGQPLGFVAADFAAQIVKIERGEQAPTLKVGNLSARREFMDVRDVVRAYADLMEQGRPGEVYNLATGYLLSVAELLETMLEVSGVTARIETDPSRFRPHDQHALVLDASRLRRLTGWRPQIQLRDTLFDILAYWRGRPAAVK